MLCTPSFFLAKLFSHFFLLDHNTAIMTKFITKGQAACLVLGEPVTDDNRVKCKKIVEGTPFEVVYTLERGITRPIAIGKAVAQRDPFSYIEYPNTPPRQDTKPDEIEAENIVIQPSESSNLSVFLRNVIYLLSYNSFLSFRQFNQVVEQFSK